MFDQSLGKTQAIKMTLGKILSVGLTTAPKDSWYIYRFQSFTRVSQYKGSSISKNNMISLEGGFQWIFKKSQPTNLSFEYGINKIKNRQTSGRDYARLAHKMDINLRHNKSNKISGVLGLNLSKSVFDFSDSKLLAETKKSQRRNIIQANIYLFINYEIQKRLKINGGCFVGQQRANLNTGQIYDRNSSVIGLQGSTLGSYRIQNCEVGMSFQFLY